MRQMLPKLIKYQICFHANHNIFAVRSWTQSAATNTFDEDDDRKKEKLFLLFGFIKKNILIDFLVPKNFGLPIQMQYMDNTNSTILPRMIWVCIRHWLIQIISNFEGEKL